jgi:hypothetical protein
MEIRNISIIIGCSGQMCVIKDRFEAESSEVRGESGQNPMIRLRLVSPIALLWRSH